MNFKKDIQEKLNSGEISYGTALILENISYPERILIYDFLKNFKLGANKMKEVVENLIEVSKRENMELKKFLKKKEIKEIIERNDVGKKRKGEILRKFLFKKRFPEYSKKKEKITSLINKLSLKEKIKVDFSRNFEDKKIKIEFKFKDLKEFEEILEILKEKKDLINEIIKNI